MSKTELKRKFVKAVYGDKLVQIGYCAAWHLLTGDNPIGYNSGVYGWNCDYHYFPSHDICISTGYNAHGVNVNDLTRDFEKRATAIFDDYNYPYESRKNDIEKIRLEWLDAINTKLNGGK